MSRTLLTRLSYPGTLMTCQNFVFKKHNIFYSNKFTNRLSQTLIKRIKILITSAQCTIFLALLCNNLILPSSMNDIVTFHFLISTISQISPSHNMDFILPRKETIRIPFSNVTLKETSSWINISKQCGTRFCSQSVNCG